MGRVQTTVRAPAVQRVIRVLEAPNPEGLSSSDLMLANHDLKPVEWGRRTWRAHNFVFFWIADGFNLNTWFIASAIISSGLNWWQAWLSIIPGYSITGIFVASTARMGATYHVGFPVLCRSAFGIWGALWPVLNRAAMACIWTGVQTWIGGQCMTLVLRAIIPGYQNIHNGIPNSGTTTRDFVSFFLFWLIQLPFVWFPVHKIKLLFTVKSVVAPAAGIAYMAWVLALAGGGGQIIRQPATVSGSDLGWAFIGGVMSSIANFATLILNAADFSRFARSPKAAQLPQAIAIPATFSLVSLVGIFVASSSTVLFGMPLWNPLDVLNTWLDQNPYDSATRAGSFFIGASFVLAQIGTNVAANTISAGSDLTALLPRFMTIRRGGYIACLVAFCMTPWNLLSSANQFTLYLSSYAVFLSSIIGVMFTDYYLVRRGRLDIRNLYTFRRDGHAWYTWGINWRAYIAYVAGIIINAPGFGNVVGSSHTGIVATRIYDLNFFGGFIVSSVIYFVLARYVAPVPGLVKKGWAEDRTFDPPADWLVQQMHPERKASQGSLFKDEEEELSDVGKQPASTFVREASL